MIQDGLLVVQLQLDSPRPTDFAVEFESLFEAGALLTDLAGTLLIAPEVRLVDDLLEIIELTLFSRCVKGTSALPDFEF